MTKQAHALRAFARRFADSSRGNVAMIFAITLPILVMITMGGVDISRASTVKSNLQDALDAATLAAARTSFVTDKDLTDVGTAALNANLAAYPGISVTSATFTMNNDRVVIANATVSVKTLVAAIVLPPYGKLMDDNIPVGAHSEVNRSSKNIEVGLVLDITGSMSGNRIADLKTAAAQLVDIVVQTTQTPFYTRMAIVPYSIGVNMGTYATGARGAPVQVKTITGAGWAAASAKVVTAMTKANPAVLTVAGHGLVTGDTVWISGLSAGSGSNTAYSTLNNLPYLVTKVSNDTFSIRTASGSNVNTSNFRTFTSNSSGVITKCLVAGCQVVITAPSHGIPATTNDEGESRPGRVYITGVTGLAISGTSQVNNKPFEVDNVTTDTYSIPVVGPNVTAWSSGGSSQCGQDGCQLRVFRNASNSALTTFAISNCVSERVGSQAYTDVSPGTARVGSNYPSASNNPCPSATIQPLTASKTTLKTMINGLTVTGSTAGQIGLAWGWYTVSPQFNSLWSSNPAGAYAPRDTLKAVILMTDGDFNSPYCAGVLAADSGSGSGNTSDHINCDATNGDPFAQAASMCQAIKAQGVIVYTVGFAVTKGSQAATILKNCATGPDYAFLPASGDDLSDDFAAIGRDITRLRISR